MYVGCDVHLVFLGVQTGLFSAVTSAFMVKIQGCVQLDCQGNELRPPWDCYQCLAELGMSQQRPVTVTFTPWGGPDPTAVHVQPSSTQV